MFATLTSARRIPGIRFQVAPLIAAALLAFDTGLSARVWKDSTGKPWAEAELIGSGGGKALLKLKDEKTVQVPLTSLSAEDQQFIAGGKGAPPAGAARTTPAAPVVAAAVATPQTPAPQAATLAPGQPAGAAPADSSTVITPFVQRYCIECHGEKKQKGKLSLAGLTGDLSKPRELQIWQAVHEALEQSEMPPSDADHQPAAAERAQVVKSRAGGEVARRW